MSDFFAPDWDKPIDIDAVIAAAPTEATIRGMFLMDFVTAAERAGKEIGGPRKYIAFKNYPLQDYLRLGFDTAGLVHPDLPVRSGLRALGHVVYPNFKETLAGSAIFAVAGKNFDRVASLASKAYNVAMDPGTVSTHPVEEKHIEVRFKDVWTFPDSLQIGVWEGALRACELEGEIKVRNVSLSDVEFDVRWT